jgi:diketogulonate reductase-like aldo/keto reductase
VAIAWVLAQGGDIVPLIGARRRNQLSESLAAANIVLSRDDMAAIEQVVPKDAALGARLYEGLTSQALCSGHPLFPCSEFLGSI